MSLKTEMRMKTTLIAATIVGGIGAVALVLVTQSTQRREMEEQRKTLEAYAKAMASLNGEVASLRRANLDQQAEQPRVRDALPVQAVEEPRASAAANEPSAQNSETRPRAAGKLSNEEALREAERKMTAKFEEEPLDASWARATQADVTEGLRDGLPAQSTVGRLECRSTMCRAEIKHANEEDYRSFAMTSLGFWVGRASAIRSAPPGSGEHSMTVFFERVDPTSQGEEFRTGH
jgi:type II secretory pathway pseudopilin PulG